MHRGQAIVLIGFMGSGKSSVGRTLATRIGRPRYDTDEMIARRFGLPIAEIFAQHGEEVFREAETEALEQMPAEAAIIVTGGGIVLRPQNCERLRVLGTVVNLTADEATLFERATRRKTRPLLRTPNPRATLSEMLRIREPLYAQVAEITIDTSTMTHAEVAETILREIERLRSDAG